MKGYVTTEPRRTKNLEQWWTDMNSEDSQRVYQPCQKGHTHRWAVLGLWYWWLLWTAYGAPRAVKWNKQWKKENSQIELNSSQMLSLKSWWLSCILSCRAAMKLFQLSGHQNFPLVCPVDVITTPAPPARTNLEEGMHSRQLAEHSYAEHLWDQVCP